MAIPKQVQDAADRADELIRQQSKPEDKRPETESEQEQPEVDESEPEKGPGEVPGDSKTETQEDAQEDRQTDLEAQNALLTSRVKSLDNENRSLKIKCAELGRQIQSMKDEVERAKQAAEEKPKKIEFSEEERDLLEAEGISDDLLNLIIKKATTDGKRPEYEKLQRETQEVRQETAELKKERFYDRLTQAVPDWQAVNANQVFLDRLGDFVPYQTYTYQQLLDDAAGRHDSETVARIFTDLRPTKEERPKRKTLSDLAEPKTKPAGSIPKQKAEQWDGAQIKKFYDEIRRDPNKYTPEQIKTLEQKHIFRV